MYVSCSINSQALKYAYHYYHKFNWQAGRGRAAGRYVRVGHTCHATPVHRMHGRGAAAIKAICVVDVYPLCWWMHNTLACLTEAVCMQCVCDMWCYQCGQRLGWRALERDAACTAGAGACRATCRADDVLPISFWMQVVTSRYWGATDFDHKQSSGSSMRQHAAAALPSQLAGYSQPPALKQR